MAKDSKWQDEYWLLLMQIYLQKPVGLKPYRTYLGGVWPQSLQTVAGCQPVARDEGL